MDVATLADLLREAEEHHGPYEKTAPEHHWSGWYTAYISARVHRHDADGVADQSFAAITIDIDDVAVA